MNVLLVVDVFLVEVVGIDLFLSMRRPEESQKVLLECFRVLGNVFLGILADQQHSAHVAFGQGVLLETVLIAHLTLTHLTVPAQPLQALGLHVVGEPFCAADFCLGHDDR